MYMFVIPAIVAALGLTQCHKKKPIVNKPIDTYSKFDNKKKAMAHEEQILIQELVNVCKERHHPEISVFGEIMTPYGAEVDNVAYEKIKAIKARYKIVRFPWSGVKSDGSTF